MPQVSLARSAERRTDVARRASFHAAFRFRCQPARSMGRPLLVLLSALLPALVMGCGGGGSGGSSAPVSSTVSAERSLGPANGNNSTSVYAADRPGMLARVARRFPARVYVPNSLSNTVSVINPRTYHVIDQFPVGQLPQHVTPPTT